MRNGIYKFNHSSGEILREEIWNNNVCIRISIYNKKGFLVSEIRYNSVLNEEHTCKDGISIDYKNTSFSDYFISGIDISYVFSNYKKHGLMKNYRSDGSLCREIDYIDNFKNGIIKGYYKNGISLKIISHLKNGLNYGNYTSFNKQGKITNKLLYIDGDLVFPYELIR